MNKDMTPIYEKLVNSTMAMKGPNFFILKL